MDCRWDSFKCPSESRLDCCPLDCKSGERPDRGLGPGVDDALGLLIESNIECCGGVWLCDRAVGCCDW